VKRIPAVAAATIVEDVDGKEHQLQEIWAEGTTVVCFLRHFG
jgi:hypothetical protein